MNSKLILIAGLLISASTFANNIPTADDNKQGVSVSIGNANTSDENTPNWIGKIVSSVKEETTLNENKRFERLDDYILDKFTGEVYFFDPHSLKYPEKIKIPREPSDTQKSVTADKVNYVLTIWKRYPCLMNIHTGDLWYMKNPGTKRAKLLYVRTAEPNE